MNYSQEKREMMMTKRPFSASERQSETERDRTNITSSSSKSKDYL